VATLGSTFTGIYEPVQEMAKALDVIQYETGWNIAIHVDGARFWRTAADLHEELIFNVDYSN